MLTVTLFATAVEISVFYGRRNKLNENTALRDLAYHVHEEIVTDHVKAVFRNS
jgi:hypothetical protein